MFKRVSFLVLALCLVMGAMSFVACTENEDDSDFYDRQFVPVGTWESRWDDGADGGVDTYKIESGKITYTTASAYGNDTWSASIVAAVDFSPRSGVLIFKYDTAPSGTYAGVHGTPYDYGAVYYRNYSPGSIQAGDAWLPDGSYRAEAKDINEALDMFTEGNTGTYMSAWGTYTK
ncbi:MAG: hypothetical protein LBQ57_09185 [Spirochaetales bacterium]|jgi:hypothetical protein|nr:hypothetical protein [Spirochaetales bacterium]